MLIDEFLQRGFYPPHRRNLILGVGVFLQWIAGGG